jgi:GNAT superfamily N-acetyltransferase
VDLFIHRTLEDTSGQFWGLYESAFADLRAVAVQRHLMTPEEFTQVLEDERVIKYVISDAGRGRIGALATMTNDLPAVPLISPDYFQRRYPELFAESRIWYVSFVAVHPDYQGTGAMAQMIGRMCQEVGDSGGVICVDICEHETRQRLSTAIEQLGNTYTPGVRRTRLDAQVYWAYEFPTPA